MTTKTKKFLVKAAIVLAMVAAIVILSVSLHRRGAEMRRVKANYEAELSGDRSRQQTVDVSELKEYFSSEVEKLKENGIPVRNVENIVEVEYRYIDTVRYRDTLIYIYDTIRATRRADFQVQARCYTIGGEIVGDTLEVSSMALYDSILMALYKEKRKCLFEKRKVKAIAIGSCSGDTLAVIRNLKIER